MTHVRVRLVLVAVTVAIWLSPGRVAAQTPAPDQADVQALKAELDKTRAEFEAVRQQYDQRLAALEQKLAQLTGTPPPGGGRADRAAAGAAARAVSRRPTPWPAGEGRRRFEGLQPRHLRHRQHAGGRGSQSRRGQPRARVERGRGVLPGNRRPLRQGRFLHRRRPRGRGARRGLHHLQHAARSLAAEGRQDARRASARSIHSTATPWPGPTARWSHGTW